MPSPTERSSWALAGGNVLAHYRVLSPLGSGGMAQVYLAEDVRLGRRLALKVLSLLQDPACRALLRQHGFRAGMN